MCLIASAPPHIVMVFVVFQFVCVCEPVSYFTSLQQYAVSAQYRKQIIPLEHKKTKQKQKSFTLCKRTTDRDSRQQAVLRAAWA